MPVFIKLAKFVYIINLWQLLVSIIRKIFEFIIFKRKQNPRRLTMPMKSQSFQANSPSRTYIRVRSVWGINWELYLFDLGYNAIWECGGCNIKSILHYGLLVFLRVEAFGDHIYIYDVEHQKMLCKIFACLIIFMSHFTTTNK